jgi:hypothetical protein
MDEWKDFFPEEIIELIRQKAEEIAMSFEALSATLYNVFAYCPPEEAETLDASIREAEAQIVTNASTSPKKHAILQHRCPRKATTHYRYIPRAPKNQPYQRRSY